MQDYAQFQKRIAAVSTKHQNMSRGYTAKVSDNGLIVVEPKFEKSSFVPRVFVLLAVGLLMIKSLLITSVGIATYENRIQVLASGNEFEQAAAWAMQPDRISQFAAQKISNLIP